VEIKKICQGENAAEVGQYTIGNGSGSVLGGFDSCVSRFLFLVVFVFLYIQVNSAIIG
jgi:hypothetical protein